jgi:Protein of unknown function (DUF2878)
MKSSARPGPSAVLINVAIYQAGWFACVLGAARDRSGLGMAVALLIVCGWLLGAPRPGALAQLIVLTGVVGYSWDSWLSVMGLIRYWPGPLSPPLAPLWILALWLLFSTTLHISLRWLQSKLRLAALLGALAAPLAYFAAARFGALTLPRLLPALVAQAAGWALLLPLLLCLARRLDA